MGKLLCAQIHEDSSLNYKVRAVVRSEEEANSVRCDLGGMTIKEGKAFPNPCDEWLEVVVVDRQGGDTDIQEKLKNVFKDADAAVLCDSSHNEIVLDQKEGVFVVNSPASENEEISARLMDEIECASTSSSLQYVLLRSTMGLSSPIDSPSRQVMGGEHILDKAKEAERKFSELDVPHAILRLGALTDDAGLVPLVFGQDDNLLRRRIGSADSRLPPILSRADAARISTFMLKERIEGVTVDCAWSPKFGPSSASTEEVVLLALRQDLKSDILSACGQFVGLTASQMGL